VTQMDTMHQHARMYGYRQPIMAYTRVFLPHTLAMRFRQIHEGEKALREMLAGEGEGRTIPVQIAGNLKPTRSNILDIGNIAAYRPGQQVYPVEPVHDPKELGDSFDKISQSLDRAFGGKIVTHEYREVVVATAEAIIALVRVQKDDGDWSSDAIRQVLDATADRYGSKVYLYVRDFDRSSTSLSQGAISGAEQEMARTKHAPVLFMMRGAKGKPWAADIWYPTVVFPIDMPAVIFNRDA